MRLQIRYTVDVHIVAFMDIIDENGEKIKIPLRPDDDFPIIIDRTPVFGYRLGYYDSFEKAELKTMKIIMDNKEKEHV